MNNCSQAPQTRRGRAPRRTAISTSWNESGMDWDAWVAEVQLAKEEFARLINASADEIAVFSSVSEATSAVASALDFTGRRRGRRCHRGRVSNDRTCVAGAGAARRERVVGARSRRARSTLAEYDAPGRRSHGYRLGVARLLPERVRCRTSPRSRRACTRPGALLYVDGYQTLGHRAGRRACRRRRLSRGGQSEIPHGCSRASRSSTCDRELIDTLHPTVTGWFGRENPFAFDAKSLDWSRDGVSRFDTGTPPVINAYIARAGMAIDQRASASAAIRAWLEVLGQRLIDGGRGARSDAARHERHAPEDGDDGVRCADSHAVEAAMRARGVLPSARGPRDPPVAALLQHDRRRGHARSICSPRPSDAS